MNFGFRTGCKNDFSDNNEKSCSWSRNRVSHKIDFKAQWPRSGHLDSVRVNEEERNIKWNNADSKNPSIDYHLFLEKTLTGIHHTNKFYYYQFVNTVNNWYERELKKHNGESLCELELNYEITILKQTSLIVDY